MFLLVPLLVIIIGVVMYYYVRNHEFSSMVWDDIDRVAHAHQDREALLDDSGLPDSMKRYLSRVLPARYEAAFFARLKQRGMFRMKAEGEAFRIEAEQYFNALEPAFVWTARIRMNTPLFLRLRDNYIQGKAVQFGRMLGATTLVDTRGPRIDSAALLRYLGEMPMFPTSFPAVQGLQWQEMDQQRVGVSLTHADICVRGVFHFNDEGDICGFSTEERFRPEEALDRPTPWRGYFDDYIEINGLRVPSVMRAAWVLDGREFLYADFRVDSVEYNIPVSW